MPKSNTVSTPLSAANTTWSKRSALIVICTILFLTFLDNTIVSVVLSGVQTDLNAGVQNLQWVVDGYMLVFAALMLSGGTLGDIFGRKKIMLGGVALFSAGSALAMIAPSVNVLVAGRIIMGVGAAASEPGTLSMIRHIYPEQRSRARALGIWAAVSGIALAFGPIIGGVLTGLYSWRLVFLLSLILGLAAFVAGSIVLPESSDPKGRSLDVPGLLLSAAALLTATLGVINGETAGYLNPRIDALFAISIACIIGFLMVERDQRDPVLNLRFFRNPLYTIANVVAFATNFGVFAIFFFTSLYLEIIVGFSGYKIALTFVAMAIAMIASAIATSRWIGRHSVAYPTVTGCLLAGGGILVVNHVMGPNVALSTLVWTLGIVGIGFGMTLVTMTSSVLSIVPPKRSGMAASTVNTFRELGGVFGVAILGAIVNAQLTSSLANRLRALGLPADFRSFVIYAITHGGNTPSTGISASALTAHAQLVQIVTNAAYAAFGRGLNIALEIAGTILLITAGIAAIVFQRQHYSLQKNSLLREKKA